jgi:3-phenylpropionate/trans-cinnamate dioxygenase ferredoxin subunit
VALLEVCRLEELPENSVRIVAAGPDLAIGVYNCAGELYALEDRCSHDDGPLCEGDFDCGEAVAVCPRHGARFDIRTGRALTLPAYLPVETYPVQVRDGVVVVEVP